MTTEDNNRNGNDKTAGFWPSIGHERYMIDREKDNGFFNPAEEVFQGSDDPIKYLPRTRIGDDEIARTSRLVVEDSIFRKGYIDIDAALRWKYNGRIGQGGAARKELRQIVGGAWQEFLEKSRGFAGQGSSSGRDINKSEIRP